MSKVELSFLIELARIGLNDRGKIFRVVRYLKEDRTAIDTSLNENLQGIELVAKTFIIQWHEKNKDKSDKFRYLQNAFDKAGLGGQFERASKDTGFTVPYSDAQLELADDSNLDDKLITLLEELPQLISSSSILFGFGTFCDCEFKEIETVRENHRADINEAGRELIQKIIKKKKGPLSKKVLDLQKAYVEAEGPRNFKILMDNNRISQADLESQIQDHIQPAADEVSGSLRHFDSLVVTEYDQAGAANNDGHIGRLAREVAREGVYDENQALLAAEQLQDPTVTRVIDLLKLLFPGQREPVRSSNLTCPSQIELGESGLNSA